MPTATTSLIRQVEDVFVEYLREEAELAGVDIVAASDRDAMVEPTHIFVTCAEAPHGGGRAHLARVAVMLVTPLHGANEAERAALAAVIEQKLREPEAFWSSTSGLKVCGWHFAAPREVSVDRQRGDTWDMLVGVRVPG
jgi:hypothetical protein